jgi:prepilin-type N-terminal cleavage/methylation domain-containing protein
MQTLVIFPRPSSRPRPNPASRGFTLLELVVVILIVGLVSMTVLPNLSGLYDSVSFAMQRETFEHDLNRLPYEAYRTQTDLFIASADDFSVSPSDAPPRPATVDATAKEIKTPAPANWRVTVEKPIIYRASGYCSGGTITVSAGGTVENYVLRPPLCEAELAR